MATLMLTVVLTVLTIVRMLRVAVGTSLLSRLPWLSLIRLMACLALLAGVLLATSWLPLLSLLSRLRGWVVCSCFRRALLGSGSP